MFLLSRSGSAFLFAAALGLSGIHNPSHAAGQISFWTELVTNPVDMTAEGTEDWVIWDGQQSALTEIRKTGANKISPLNLPAFMGSDIYHMKFTASWTDGTPVATSAPTLYPGVVINSWWGGPTNSFTVPADQTPRTLRFYVRSWKTGGTIRLHLSDASADSVLDNSLIADAEYCAAYVVVYRANSPGQTLTVGWESFGRTGDWSSAGLGMIGATLRSGAVAQPSTAPPAPTLRRIVRGDGMASLIWMRVNQATSYNIYRSTVSGNTGATPYLAGKVAFFTEFFPGDYLFYGDHGDYGLTNGTTYYYQITAVNGTVESARSAQISVTPTAAPTREITRKRFIKILPMGNSITVGPVNTNWRKVLEDSLIAGGYDFTYVGSQYGSSDGMVNPYSEGWGLRKVDDLRRGVATRALIAYDPDLVHVEIGTNNFAWGSPSQQDVDNALNDYTGLLSAIFDAKPNVYVLVSPILPLDSATGTAKTPYVNVFNAGVKAKVDSLAHLGKHAIWVSEMSTFPYSLIGDGAHPSDAGYKLMAGIIYRAIKSITNDQAVGVPGTASRLNVPPGFRDSQGTSHTYSMAGARVGCGTKRIGRGIYISESGRKVSARIAVER